MAAAIGTNYSEQSSANITITGNVTVNATAMSGAAIGSGSYNSSVGDITIYGGATVVVTDGNGGAAIGSGYNDSNIGDINIYSGANVTATSTTDFNDAKETPPTISEDDSDDDNQTATTNLSTSLTIFPLTQLRRLRLQQQL